MQAWKTAPSLDNSQCSKDRRGRRKQGRTSRPRAKRRAVFGQVLLRYDPSYTKYTKLSGRPRLFQHGRYPRQFGEIRIRRSVDISLYGIGGAVILQFVDFRMTVTK